MGNGEHRLDRGILIALALCISQEHSSQILLNGRVVPAGALALQYCWVADLSIWSLIFLNSKPDVWLKRNEHGLGSQSGHSPKRRSRDFRKRLGCLCTSCGLCRARSTRQKSKASAREPQFDTQKCHRGDSMGRQALHQQDRF
jgi:hypothetical protein